MNFEQNITPIPGTKRVRYTCVECGLQREGYASTSGKNKYCSTSCSARANARNMKQKMAIPFEDRPKAEEKVKKYTAPKGSKGERLMFKCATCKTKFERYHYKDWPTPKFCKRECIRRPSILAMIDAEEVEPKVRWECEGCHKNFYRLKRKNENDPRFCTVICKNKSITNGGKTINKRQLPKTIIIQKPDNEPHSCTINRFVFFTCLATNIALMYYIILK